MRITAVILLILLSACTPAPTTQHHQILAFGTIINVTIRHRDEQLINRAVRQLEADFLTMHKTWHPWEPGPIKRVNTLLPTGDWFGASGSVLPLIQRAKTLARQSDDFFNPAIGKLVQHWGFHRHDSSQPFTPDMAAIDELRANIPTMEDVEIDGITMRGLNPHLQIDLGGIAKGYALEQAVKTLRRMRVEHAILDAGGDIKVIGQHDRRPWQIGIQHPRDRDTSVIASIDALSNEAVFTSGDYRRFYLQDGKRRHHIIDPKTGEPVSHTIAVTVIHPDATLADAAATALLAAGADKMAAIAKKMGVRHVFLVTDQRQFVISRAMYQRLKINNEHAQTIRILDI